MKLKMGSTPAVPFGHILAGQIERETVASIGGVEHVDLSGNLPIRDSASSSLVGDHVEIDRNAGSGLGHPAF